MSSSSFVAFFFSHPFLLPSLFLLCRRRDEWVRLVLVSFSFVLLFSRGSLVDSFPNSLSASPSLCCCVRAMVLFHTFAFVFASDLAVLDCFLSWSFFVDRSSTVLTTCHAFVNTLDSVGSLIFGRLLLLVGGLFSSADCFQSVVCLVPVSFPALSGRFELQFLFLEGLVFARMTAIYTRFGPVVLGFCRSTLAFGGLLGFTG